MAVSNESVSKNSASPSLLLCGKQLSPEWTAISITDQRIYFVNQRTRSSHWFPPPEFWTSKLGLPYGWEAALDDHNKKYYINHVTRATTREDPRSEADQANHLNMTPPQSRRIEVVRDAKIGFGFVAGSEKPVVIRSVIPNGPSHDKLFANDQILKVNGTDVRSAAQADVISLIKSAVGRIELEVVATEDVQDSKNQRNRKSSLMSRTTRERRRSTPVSVRFADEPALVQVIGPTEPVRRSSVPLIPNVLKVFLENGQTRSFRYDSNTTAEEIFSSFSSKLDVKLMEHFSLVLSGPKKGQISYIQNNEKISEIYTNRNCSSVNCICKLIIAFVPKDHFELLSEDPNTFEYLYAQVSNRVVEGFYGMDLKYDLAIKLAALQIQQKAMEAAAGRPVKISVRQVEKEFGGLAKFVMSDLLNNTKEKELRKILDQQIKQNENLASPGERYMSSLQCKLHYLNLAVEMFSYGGRYFDAKLLDNGSEGPSLKKTKKQHITVLINLKYGVSQVIRGKVNVLCQLAELHEITGFSIRRDEDNKRLLQIKLQEGKKIQLICSTVDCLDIIALITGYYKVYVDNTTNTPLPVENEERWPFTFQRSPPVNDAPDYYSRHRVVPDVWSYPSHFQISNTKRKPQVENSKPLSDHKDVYIDLSSAPPRYTSNETAISEESEDDVVADKTSQRQKVEIEIAHGQKSRKYDALVTQTPHSSRGDLTHMQEDDNTGLVLSDKDHELLETASSFLKSRPEDNITDETELDFSYDSEIAADSEELLASRKRPHVLSEGHGEENVALKSSKTELAETMEENQDDLISELILAEELWQEENAGVSVIDAGNKPVERVSTDSGDSFVAVERKSDERNSQTNNSIREQRWLNDVGEIPGEVSTNTENFQFEDGEKGIVSGNVDENDLRAYLDSSNHSLGTTDVNQNVLIDCSTTKIASLADDSGSESPAFSTVEGYLNLDLSSEHDPFIRTDPFQDRSPSPSPRDLGFDESKFDNKGIELVDFQENEASQELHEQESAVSILGKCVGNDRNGSDDSDENERKSPETFNSFDELKLKVDSSLIGNGFSDGTEGVNEDNFEDALDSHLISLEFSEGSETETESAMSDDGESLWSTFPEYFQPSGRLTYSSNKSANLSLAEEDQYEDVVNSPEADREVALVSVKELNVRDESNSNSFVDISARKNGISLLDDCDELSTASSESFEYTYEVNAEIPSESEEMSEDSGYVNFKENNKRSTEGIYNKVEETSSFSSHSSVDVCLTDECDISSGNYSNFNDKASKVNALTALFSTNTKSTSHFDQCSEGQFLEKNDLTEMSKESEVSSLLRDAPLKRAVVGSTEVISTERFSLRESDDKRMLIDRSYSPSDWIMPSPPTPTPELQDDDIPIVSPPPVSPTPVEDKLDEELRRLIVTPPPSSVDILPMVSGIRIASPPPLNFSDNELDRLMYDYDDIRFLSLTDDHKLAKTNGLVSTRNVDSNFTEDRKIQAQKVAVDPPMIRKQSIAVSSRDESNFNSLENPSNGNHCLIKDNSSTFTSHLFESRCWPNPSVCDSSTLFDSNTTCKDGRILGDFRSKDVVKGLDNPEVITRNDGRLKKTAELSSISGKNNQDIIERGTRFPSKQKPPIPPKPRMFRSTSGEGNVGSAKHPLENAMGKPTYGVPKSSSARHSVDKLAKSHSDSSSVKNTDTSNETSSNSVYHSFRRVFATDNPPITEQSHKASSPETFVPNSPSSTNSKDSPSRNEINPQADKRGTRRSLSFTCRSPYVPAPYSSSLTQSLNSAPSSAETLHKSTLCNNSNSSAENPTETIETDCFNITRSFGTQTFPSSANSTTASSKELLFHQELRPSMRQPASDLSCKNSINNLNRVLSEDGTNRTFPKQPTDSSNLQHRTSELQHDICNNSLTPPPLPDSPPPPLPSSSPPKIIPQFDLEDFDFGEPLIETFYDNTPSVNVESNTSLDLPSFTKDLKSTHSLESQNESRSSCPERREKLYGGSTLFRSLTLTSFPRDINRRSLSEDWSCHRDAGFPSSPIKRSSFPFDESPDLDDIATNSIHHLEEFQVKAFRVKCSHVCEDGLLKVGVLKNRLEMCLNKSVSNPQTTGEKKNWLLIFQNNARFLACDIKVISSSVKRGSPQVVSALKTSLDSLEKLVESCENTYSVLNDTCDRNGRTLVAMVSEVLEQYRDVICTVKAASGQQADSPDVEALVKNSNAVAALISSLIRTLRRY